MRGQRRPSVVALAPPRRDEGDHLVLQEESSLGRELHVVVVDFGNKGVHAWA